MSDQKKNDKPEVAIKEAPSKNKIMIKWAINIIIPLLIFLIPIGGDYTAQFRMFFVVTAFGIILLATENIPLFAGCLLLPLLYAIVLEQPNTVVYKSWTEDVPWMMLGGSILTMAMNKTGFLKRLSYRCVLLFGGSFRGILFGMMFFGVVISSVLSGIPVKAIILGSVAIGICNAMDFKLGSKEASAIGLAAIAATLGPSYLYLTGSGGNIVTFNAAASVGVQTPEYFEYMTHMAIPQLIYVVLTIFAIDIMFRPKVAVQSSGYLKEELAKLGKTTLPEKKVIVLFVLLLIGLITTAQTGLKPHQLFISAAIILMCPGVSIVSGQDISKVNFTQLFFVLACLTIGNVSSALGVGSFLANTIYPYISGSISSLMAGVWGFGMAVNFGLTPTAAYSTFTGPIVEMANAAGMNPIPLLYTFVHGLEQILLPYEYAPALIIFGYGMISMGNFVKYNLVRALISIGCIFLIFIPYWTLIGLM